jgi:hypothetical protein
LSFRHRYVTELIPASGSTPTGHPSRYHRFFSQASWFLDELGGILARLLVAAFAATGFSDLAVDDPLCRKRGLTKGRKGWKGRAKDSQAQPPGHQTRPEPALISPQVRAVVCRPAEPAPPPQLAGENPTSAFGMPAAKKIVTQLPAFVSRAAEVGNNRPAFKRTAGPRRTDAVTVAKRAPFVRNSNLDVVLGIWSAARRSVGPHLAQTKYLPSGSLVTSWLKAAFHLRLRLPRPLAED